MPDLRTNIRWFFLLSAIKGAATGMPIVLWVVFLQRHHGLNLTQVTLLDLPFWFGILLFEIPTGVVADKFGRRTSLILGALVGTCVWLVFAMAPQFWMLAAAQFVGSLAATFASGADEALLFESMKALDREGEYAQVSARARATRTASAMVAGVGVGVIAETNIVLPAFLTAGLIALSLVPILCLKETLAKKTAAEAPVPYREIVGKAIRTLKEHEALRWAMIYLIVVSSVAFYAEVFLQPYALSVGVHVAALGVVMVGIQAMSIAGALAVGRVKKKYPLDRLFILVPLLLIPCLSVLALWPSLPALAAAAVAAFLFAMTEPVLLAAIQRKVPDEARATVLSIRSAVAMVFLILTEPALGMLADRTGVAWTYAAMAALLLVFLTVLALRGKRWLGEQRGAEA